MYTLTTQRFKKSLLWGTFSKAYVFGARKRRLRVDGRLKRRKKSPFSNKNGYEWMFFMRVDVQKTIRIRYTWTGFSGYVRKRPNYQFYTLRTSLANASLDDELIYQKK